MRVHLALQDSHAQQLSVDDDTDSSEGASDFEEEEEEGEGDDNDGSTVCGTDCSVLSLLTWVGQGVVTG